jgi:L-fuconolactonase
VDVALDAFGPERLIYGSDWPLNEMCAGPAAWWRAVDELSPTEQQAIMGGTATAFYRLANRYSLLDHTALDWV